MIKTVSRRNVRGLEYELSYKKVKNLNLRIRTDGSVMVSAPRRVPVGEVDRFVESRLDWIIQARQRVLARAALSSERDVYSDEECLRAFTPVFERFYPLFAGVLPQKPLLRVRLMKSRWGVCHPGRNYITLNKLLISRPLPALEYVVLHELAHFIHPDHQAGFHALMARLMPDYRQRRALLNAPPSAGDTGADG